MCPTFSFRLHSMKIVLVFPINPLFKLKFQFNTEYFPFNDVPLKYSGRFPCLKQKQNSLKKIGENNSVLIIE